MDVNKLEELYVKKGYSVAAISAAISSSIGEIESVIKEKAFDAKRELFLEQNPNVSAAIANQRQLKIILKKQQESQELSNAELTFLAKLTDLQAKESAADHDEYYKLSKEELDDRIKKLFQSIYNAVPASYYRDYRARKKKEKETQPK